MSYVHYDGVSANADGFAVGAKGSERKMIGQAGCVYLPLRNAAGALQKSTSKQTSAVTTSPAFTTGGASFTLTKKVTITQPVHYLKAKAVAKCTASITNVKVGVLVNGSTATTSTTSGKTTSCTTTKDMTAALTGSTNYVTAKATVKHTAATTKKVSLSIPTLSFDKQALYYPKAQ
jgi:hypothetical protein